MAKRLDGKVAVISGAAAGIGQASAVRLAEEGARIVIADREDAGKTLQLIKSAGGKAQAIRCDVSDPESVAGLQRQVEQGAGRCDILVNNAGIYPMQSFDEITFDDWRRVFSVNLDSMFLMTKAFVGFMRERRWGRIVNIASDTVGLVVPGFTHYIASKAASSGSRALWRRSSARKESPQTRSRPDRREPRARKAGKRFREGCRRRRSSNSWRICRRSSAWKPLPISSASWPFSPATTPSLSRDRPSSSMAAWSAPDWWPVAARARAVTASMV